MKSRNNLYIILGIVLAVLGLVLIIERHEIALQMVGGIAYWGGSSYKTALTGMTVGGVAGLIIGLILLVFGLRGSQK